MPESKKKPPESKKELSESPFPPKKLFKRLLPGQKFFGDKGIIGKPNKAKAKLIGRKPIDPKIFNRRQIKEALKILSKKK